jgi:serine/threonine protein phosphatase PrpC
MVGNGAVDAPNVASVQLADDEMLVLCSDGLHKHVDPQEIQRRLRARAPLARAAGLVDARVPAAANATFS